LWVGTLGQVEVAGSWDLLLALQDILGQVEVAGSWDLLLAGPLGQAEVAGSWEVALVCPWQLLLALEEVAVACTRPAESQEVVDAWPGLPVLVLLELPQQRLARELPVASAQLQLLKEVAQHLGRTQTWRPCAAWLVQWCR